MNCLSIVIDPEHDFLHPFEALCEFLVPITLHCLEFAPITFQTRSDGFQFFWEVWEVHLQRGFIKFQRFEVMGNFISEHTVMIDDLFLFAVQLFLLSIHSIKFLVKQIPLLPWFLHLLLGLLKFNLRSLWKLLNRERILQKLLSLLCRVHYALLVRECTL